MKQQTGFSLIEMLVALAIFSIGMLGIAALQVKAVRYNHDAYVQTLVMNQTDMMIDRMRNNPAGRQAGNYNNVTGIPVAKPSCTICSPADMAQLDAFEWNTNNANLLPAGQGTVTGDGEVFTITIRWDRDKTGATGTNCSGDSDVDLACYSVGVEL